MTAARTTLATVSELKAMLADIMDRIGSCRVEHRPALSIQARELSHAVDRAKARERAEGGGGGVGPGGLAS